MITLGATAATSARKSRTQKRGIIFTAYFFLSFLLLSNKRFVPYIIYFMPQKRLDLELEYANKNVCPIPCAR